MQLNCKSKENMEVTQTYPKRTREEVLAWIDRAKQRKEAWKKKTLAEMEHRVLLRKQAMESHYYDIDWV